MAISKKLIDRNSGSCELCNASEATNEYTVSPKSDSDITNQVALCDTCHQSITQNVTGDYWRFLEGTIWNPEPSIQALSYRLLYACKEQDWANDIINSVEPDENIVQWALSIYEVADIHKDAFGNALANGDNVVLTQGLDVKGTSFSAPKGTIVKKIRLVPDNTDQIEGKINEQTIVILTKYVRKG